MRNLAICAPLTEHYPNLATLGSERDSGWRVVWRPREEVFDLGSARNGIVSAR